MDSRFEDAAEDVDTEMKDESRPNYPIIPFYRLP